MGQEGSWQQSAGYKNQQCEEEFCTRLPLGVGLNPSRVKESFRTGSSLVGDSETQLIYGGHFCKGHPPPTPEGVRAQMGVGSAQAMQQQGSECQSLSGDHARTPA